MPTKRTPDLFRFELAEGRGVVAVFGARATPPRLPGSFDGQ